MSFSPPDVLRLYESAMRQSGHVFWLFGLSGAGKSTVAAGLGKAMQSRGQGTLALDGDVVRAGLNKDLGFSDRDRSENLRRAAEIARLGRDSGLCVIASFITPLEQHRILIREIVGADGMSLIYLNATVEVCISRDRKGLYAEAHAGKIRDMTGVSSPFEAPGFFDLMLNTNAETEMESCERLVEFSRTRIQPWKI